jgi:hypothetical protein
MLYGLFNETGHITTKTGKQQKVFLKTQTAMMCKRHTAALALIEYFIALGDCAGHSSIDNVLTQAITFPCP